MKILIAEDNEDSRNLLVKVVRAYGHEVMTAADGVEALEQALTQPPDIIVSDILMPKMDGYQLCRECKQSKQLKNIPFVFYTATYTLEEDKKFALSVGAAAFILKPTEPDILMQMLSEVFEEAKAGALPPPEVVPLEPSLFLAEHDKRISAKLEDKVTQLEAEIAQRKQVEEELQKAYKEVEKRVEERTAELGQANTELAAVNKELEAFSYSVSHDLRAPLRSIDGFSQVLMEDYLDKLDEQGKNYLQRVRSATQHMAQLIDDILNLSRIGRREMKHEKVNLSALAETIAAELKKSQPERPVEFIIAKDLTASGDTGLLQVLLENLLGNAWKFTGDRLNARIEFGVTQIDDKKTFFVHDDGVGFDMAYVDKLFGAFQRLHSQDEFPGTGIGLATVQRIVHRHGGRVRAEGEVEKGATFYFTLD